MEAKDYLERPRLHPLLVVFGEETFLRRQVLTAIRRLALGDSADEFGLSVHSGDTATFAAVLDEVRTLALFGDRRLVIVESADEFVKNHRPALEKAVGTLEADANVLVLDVKSWPSTTRLSKMVGPTATIDCKAPQPWRMPQWCVAWAASAQKKKLAPAAASLLVDLIGPDMALLDQEILKLAVYVGVRPTITAEDVDRLVGRSRVEQIWTLFDQLGAGKSAEALTLLDRLLDHGEDPIRLLGAFSMQLRRVAKAYRLNRLGKPLGVAISEAGVPPFAARACEQQLRQIGRRRAEKLYDWLLEADLGIKGSSQLQPRALLERLVVRLA
jgi:DNA polymerase-3 subunit delta